MIYEPTAKDRDALQKRLHTIESLILKGQTQQTVKKVERPQFTIPLLAETTESQIESIVSG